VIEKLPEDPEVLETIASLEPVASVTTEAVTPSLSPLMVLARSFRLSAAVPLPVGIVTEAPAVVERVKDDAGRIAVGLLAGSEYHDPVVARLLTTIVWLPAGVPAAAPAETIFEFEEIAVRADSGPVREFRFCKSVWTASVAFCMAVRAVVWLLSVVWSACHARSGARSA
jgi:hypothetical protein